MNEIEYIKSRMTKPELLAALAEECAELAQAALKLRRVLDGSNPTPVTEEQATANLLEEYADMGNCLDVILTPEQIVSTLEMRQAKKARWVNRLRGDRAGSGWISVAEMLPECEPGAEVGPLLYRTRAAFVYAGFYGTFGKYRDKYFRQYHDGNEGIDASDVTHWMPISEPPEEG